ncbi:extensin-like domain-containing protein [Salinarimonas ramus]|uniref:Extensin n=1 Tax=Salinarimonas ramus TaxID=690164 RepID=A0A917Q3T7_9HYPH|nr:extensin family protein [Salinarimonas ramus]GGK18525.1 extensin [Salinarimonas ramus]
MRLRALRLAGAAALALAAGGALAQEADGGTPPAPPERPADARRLALDPPLPVARPDDADELAEEDASEPQNENEAESGEGAVPDEETALEDARTDDAPHPPRRPVVEEPEAVLPDEPRAPLSPTPEERAAYEACLGDLAALDVAFEERPAIDGDGRCGTALPLRVSALDGIALQPAVTVQCDVALALAHWSEQALLPAAREHLDAEPQTLYTAGAYVCRGRNRQPNARLSEHAFANAVDITGMDFAEGEAFAVEPRGGVESPQARFQREIRRGACAHFRTVLGPGSDAYHDDHLHFDQRERRNDYRLCE